jgi:hypothetical protein
MAIATYAALVNEKSSLVKRTQSLSKISEPGLGVIYYWLWGWSYSQYKREDGEMSKAALGNGGNGFEKAPKKLTFDENGSGNEGLYGRFMYLGLTVQNPTMTRINAHLSDAARSGGQGSNSKANALYQATEGSATIYGNSGTIQGKDVPTVMHLVSWFDLDNLESYYIKEYNLSNKSGKTFLEQIQESSKAKVPGSDQPTIGVNAAGGGQGGTFKQDKDRGIVEWVGAAYFFLKERDPDVIASRSADAQNIYKRAIKYKTLAEQIQYVFEGFSQAGNGKLVIPALMELFSTYSIDKIRYILNVLGYSASGELKPSKQMTEEEIKRATNKDLSEGFSTKNLMSKAGQMFVDMFSFEVEGTGGLAKEQFSPFKKYFSDKQNLDLLDKDGNPKPINDRETFIPFTKVKSELRASSMMDFLGFNNIKKVFTEDPEDIISKITQFTGLDKISKLMNDIKVRHQQMVKQNQELSFKYYENYNKLSTINKELPSIIKETTSELVDFLEKHFEKYGGQAIIGTIPEFLLKQSKTSKVGIKPALAKVKKDSAKQVARKLSNKFKAPKINDEKVLKQFFDAVRPLYNKFSMLQSYITLVIAMQDTSKMKPEQVKKNNNKIKNIERTLNLR